MGIKYNCHTSENFQHDTDIYKKYNPYTLFLGLKTNIQDKLQELQDKLKLAKGSVTLKVIPRYYDIPIYGSNGPKLSYKTSEFFEAGGS
jgi:hypothetical protein